jgi:hypothetical protein
MLGSRGMLGGSRFGGGGARRRLCPRVRGATLPSTSEHRPVFQGAAACTCGAPTVAEAGARTKASAVALDRGKANGQVDKGASRTGGTGHEALDGVRRWEGARGGRGRRGEWDLARAWQGAVAGQRSIAPGRALGSAGGAGRVFLCRTSAV